MDPANGPDPKCQPACGTKVFAWAGLRFCLPSGWETGQLEKDHGWLESDFKPVMEFKTAIVRGRFSFRRHLKQLETASSLRLKRVDMPVAWRSHLNGFHARAFTWQGPRLGGDGLLIYCPACRRATLLQFFRNGGAVVDAVVSVLASFSDHGTAPRPTLAVYDIQATVPLALSLKRFRFDSGRFELVYGDRRRLLTLWRWSPADAALRHHNDSLPDFARFNGLPADADPSAPSREVNQGVEWCWPLRRTWRNRLPLRFRRRLPPAAFRIWHRPAVNRILAVRADGQMDYDLFTEICRDYEIVS